MKLAEFFVHTTVCAHRRDILIRHFQPENRLRLQVGEESLFPDCAFELHTPDEQRFTFYVELDNGTERLCSDQEADSWQRKIGFYEQFQDACRPHRFRVLVLLTRSRDRLEHILALATTMAGNPQRSLILCSHLADYLEDPDALLHPCFHDHHGAVVPLVRPAALSIAPLARPGSMPYSVGRDQPSAERPPSLSAGSRFPVTAPEIPRVPRSGKSATGCGTNADGY